MNLPAIAGALQQTLGFVCGTAVAYNKSAMASRPTDKTIDLGRDQLVRHLVRKLHQQSTATVKLAGNWGSFGALLASYLLEQLKRPILYVCAHIDEADQLVDDLQTFGAEAQLLAAWEADQELADATDEIRAERSRVVLEMTRLPRPMVVTAAVQALCQPVPKPEALERSCLRLAKGEEIGIEQLTTWLVDNGFERVEQIELPGQFARRGGIVDIYAPLAVEVKAAEQKQGMTEQAEPLRVEFFGQMIESIRRIDLDTHLSCGQLQAVSVISAVCGTADKQREQFLRILPRDCIVLFEEPVTVEEAARIYHRRVENPVGLYRWEEIFEAAQGFAQIHLCRFATGQPGQFLDLGVRSIQQYQHKASSIWSGHKAALEELIRAAEQGKEVLFYCESQAELNRLGQILREIRGQVPRRLRLVSGYVSRGFELSSLGTVVISHHEVFGQVTLRRRRVTTRATVPVDTLSDLQVGDYVVHASYGIGKFLGTKTIREKGGISEYLTIEYADGVKMQVSVRNIGLVQKYIGTSPKRPKLSKVGSKRWQRQKEKVAAAVRDLAAELLELQAQRQALGGIAYGQDSGWQVEFEQAFAYPETPDQSKAASEIKADMQRPVAMDRLLCGDVGYGKTELAMRAAFKAVDNGKQVAVLVPTTVLSVQHGRTFTERFADFPVCIEVLNRFKSPSEARDIIERTKAGKVDILIGTHRLLSDDVGFRDLGLLIIDEEQRFGVEHKEKLKRLRVNVDVLTMTATPIPRTLHMALLGLRDISSLATPPLDRRSIVTKVTGYDDNLIRRAIYRELNRQGQVFFLHNRVRSIEKKAWEISKLVPEARIGIAHGQMGKRELEDTMVRFVLGQIDVLVCTTIIESGLDIPNANTIFINDADRFGLAELHQLRGRVGRYKHRAYAYLLLPRSRPVSPLATKRLKAIEEYSHLGAGFRIALRDLEIRGAGNILGPEQSGHIQTVGYQMYCELLAEAVRRLKNEPIEPVPSAVVELGFCSYIPRSYIGPDRQRMDVYRKMAVARCVEDLEQLEAELTDVYGPVPQQVRLLLGLSELRILASRAGIRSISASPPDLIFTLEQEGIRRMQQLFSRIRGSVRMVDHRRVYVQLSQSYFEPETLLAVLRKMLR